jgi:hypothetical protein
LFDGHRAALHEVTIAPGPFQDRSAYRAIVLANRKPTLVYSLAGKQPRLLLPCSQEPFGGRVEARIGRRLVNLLQRRDQCLAIVERQLLFDLAARIRSPSFRFFHELLWGQCQENEKRKLSSTVLDFSIFGI